MLPHLTSRVPRGVGDPDEDPLLAAVRPAPGGGGADDDWEEERKRGMPVQDGVPLPWPARNREGRRNKVADVFYQGHLQDYVIARWVQSHLCTLILSGLLLFALCLLAWRWLILRSLSRVSPSRASPFCAAHPHECLRNLVYRSLLRDYRHTRDAQRLRGARLRPCSAPIRLHYDDARLGEWWGELLAGQEAGLPACPTPCEVTGERGDAHVLVRLFEPTRREHMAEGAGQLAAVVNTEAHSLSREILEGTDLLVSYHKRSDVVVSYAYALKHGVPCSSPQGDCLRTAVAASLPAPPAPGGPGAVLFMSGTCDRHGGYVADLVAALRREGGMGVDSFGKCFHSASEASHPLRVEGRLGASKERISSQYDFHIVVENELVDDYVTEKFYEGLKATSVMVYLGAPNARDYAPAGDCFVDASRFGGPGELAAHLEALRANATAMEGYRAWRGGGGGVSAGFLGAVGADFGRRDEGSWQCRLCGAMRARYCEGDP